MGSGRSRIEIFSWPTASQSVGGEGGGGSSGGAGDDGGGGVAGGSCVQTVSFELSEHDWVSPPVHLQTW